MFMPYKIGHVGIIPWQELPAAAGDVKVGMAMVMTGGKLTKAGATTAPTHICMCTKTAEAGELIPVLPADADVIFETVLSEASSGIAVGTKYTIDATGGKITATSTSGVAEVVSFDGTAKGSKVRVKF